ncbi:hypothetical protein [Corynebacterium urealyticum]|nr:hypothetical protein [Corynebacterium urealyticum]WOH94169.1 hypothetical protein RZ943_09030 [Corynebacterium urealyticum]
MFSPGLHSGRQFAPRGSNTINVSNGSIGWRDPDPTININGEETTIPP